MATADEIFIHEGMNSEGLFVATKTNECIKKIFEYLYDSRPEEEKSESLISIFSILSSISVGSFSTEVDSEDNLSDKERLVNFYRNNNANDLANNIEELDNIVNYPDQSKLLTSLRNILEIKCQENDNEFEESEEEVQLLKEYSSKFLKDEVEKLNNRIKNFNTPSHSRATSAISETENTLPSSDEESVTSEAPGARPRRPSATSTSSKTSTPEK